MLGHVFFQYEDLGQKSKANFETLLKLFSKLLLYTAGDVQEAISWLNELDREYKLTDDNYGIGDFIEDLEKKGYIKNISNNEQILLFTLTPKFEKTIREEALEEIFGKLKRSAKGNHLTPYSGQSEEPSGCNRPYVFGDPLEQIQFTESIKNAQINHGIHNFFLDTQDLEVIDTEAKVTTSTVLMIDVSHSMILYGEDRITPAKMVAMALAELIMRKYPKDNLDILAFGNEAWPIELKDLPYLQAGPYHTNTVAGLELALDILRRRKTHNKQIFMITDGKPTCLKEGNHYYKNSFGLDRKIVNKVLNLAAYARRLGIPITTFMIAKDPYLQKFVEEFTETNRGRAFYSSPSGLGNYIFQDFVRNRKRNVR
ncbi:MAG: VWA domain-containing protein [Bacteroidia bacterium]|nr:VWA domain-containing protein [Bacteroidia bacterium]MDW8157382.1 VWA domain-containing protein [Bacteroidia bacterium]